MGLDSVELVIAVEEEFNLSIPDDAATEMRTVGDMVDYLQNHADAGTLSTNKLVDWIDHNFERVIGKPVSSLPSETKVIDVLAHGKKKRQWAKLSALLPGLVRPWWARSSIPLGLLLVGTTISSKIWEWDELFGSNSRPGDKNR